MAVLTFQPTPLDMYLMAEDCLPPLILDGDIASADHGKSKAMAHH
jgi:hypothetical protein